MNTRRGNCRQCRGTGRVPARFGGDELHGHRAVEWGPCDSCGGTGHIPSFSAPVILPPLPPVRFEDLDRSLRQLEGPLINTYLRRVLLRFGFSAVGALTFAVSMSSVNGLSYRFWGLPLAGAVVEMFRFIFRTHGFWYENRDAVCRFHLEYNGSIGEGFWSLALFIAGSMLVGFNEVGECWMALKSSFLSGFVFLIVSGIPSNARASVDVPQSWLWNELARGSQPFRLVGKWAGLDRRSLKVRPSGGPSGTSSVHRGR